MDLAVPEMSRRLRKAKLGVILLAAVCVLTLSLVRHPGGDINYYNSDATWHVLMTMQAYEETPASVHKFVPLINMGGEGDKGISWGATIPDQQGNYYYTSFSAAGFVLPYLFLKLFQLPIAESSLYLFNCLLYFASTALFGVFVTEVFRKTKRPFLVGAIAVVACACPPEVLHGMGVVYWPQSVLQVTLLIQLYAYYRYVDRGSKAGYGVFLLLCLLNPYIEWTGFVANGGFILLELFRLRKQWKRALLGCLLPGVLTVLSFVLFSAHYLWVVTLWDYLEALKNRFIARSTVSNYPFSRLFTGYIDSFLWLWVLLGVLFVAVVLCWRGFTWTKRSVLLRHKWLLFVTLFPVIENILMKGHAILYTYDRMKLIFPLTLILCDLCALLLEKCSAKVWKGVVCAAVLAAAAGNVCSYVGNEAYIWRAEYRENNRILGQYVVPYEADSVMGCTAYGGRSIYLDFERGVHEYVDLDTMTNMAQEAGKRYAILLQFGEDALTSWGMPTYDRVEIYDTQTNELKVVRVTDGAVNVVVSPKT